MKINKLSPFLEEKTNLTDELEKYKKIIEKNPELLNSVPNDLRAKARRQAQQFEQIVEENGRQVKKARKVHQIVMDAIKTIFDQTYVAIIRLQ